MTITQFDHLGIVVGDLDAAVTHYRTLFRVTREDIFYDEHLADGETPERLKIAFVRIGPMYVELIEPGDSGPMRDFLETRGGGIHHVALTSDNVREDWQRHESLREQVGLIDKQPNVDAHGASYWFLHPRANQRVLFEVQSEWARTDADDMTPVRPTPDWSRELGNEASA